MSYFDVLSACFAALTLVSVYQMRPCTMILSGNNMLLSRSLANFERAGSPVAFWFLPTSLFSSENLATAGSILTIMLAATIGCAFLFMRHRGRIASDAPPVPPWVLFVVGAYLVAYTGAKGTILSTSYNSESRYNLELAGGHAFLLAFVVYEVIRRRLLSLWNTRKAFIVIFLIAAATGYARGGTGLTTGVLFISAMMVLPRGGAGHRLGNVVRLGLALSVVFAISYVVRGVRGSLATEGTSAISSYVRSVSDVEASRDDTGEGAEVATNSSQSAVQMLMCTYLYDTGNSREWRSIYNVVEYTFMPSYLAYHLGWTRSIEPAWELRSHFIHMGGINVLGEFYWNGGYLCVVIMIVVLSLFCSIVDTRCRLSPFWLMMVVQFGPSFLMGYAYGFPQVARGAINGLIAAGGYQVLTIIRRSHEPTTFGVRAHSAESTTSAL